MISALISQTHWLCFGTEGLPLKLLNPIRPLMNWYNTRRMNRYISRELKKQLKLNQDGTHAPPEGTGKRSIIDLALKSYLQEAPESKRTATEIDEAFKTFAAAQIKLFIFSGHDTTASTLCYIYYLLAQNAGALKQLRAEHDSVLGPDISRTSSHLLEDPYLLNQLPDTVAVIKETLRLYPPASSTRAGEPGYYIRGSNGLQYPTSGFLVCVVHQAMHRDPAYWPQPESFLVERWLVPEDHALHPIKEAWRAFEFGPRNCIGQELAMLEMKAIIAMTARESVVEPAFGEWDVTHPIATPKRVGEDRAYQVVLGSARPCDNFPCTVRLTRPN